MTTKTRGVAADTRPLPQNHSPYNPCPNAPTPKHPDVSDPDSPARKHLRRAPLLSRESGDAARQAQPANDSSQIRHDVVQGLNPKEGEEGQAVSLHDLRHTAISRWIAAGLDVVEVQRQAGHANPAITLRLYAGAFEEADVGRRDARREKLAEGTAIRLGS
jgi:integrase